MIRWFAKNANIKLAALLLAVMVVFFKAQEKIQERILPNIPVSVENRPVNLVLPDRWAPPSVRCKVEGPRNLIDLIRPDMCRFQIDLSSLGRSESGDPVTFVLSGDMLKTNLEREDQRRVTMDPESVRPRQVAVRIVPWDIRFDKPAAETAAGRGNQVEIPLYQLRKEVPIRAPAEGGSGLDIEIRVSPPTLTLTGRMEALAQIQSVSTMTLDLRGIRADTLPMSVPLESFGDGADVWPLNENIRDVTVAFSINRNG